MDPVLEWLLDELGRATKKIEKDSADAWRHVTCLGGEYGEFNRALADIEVIQGGVERVQDITEGDAMAEGAPWEDCWSSYRQSFEALWCRTYGPQSWSWNLWAWVIEFRRIEA